MVMDPDLDRLDDGERLARLALYLGLKANPGAFHRVMRRVGRATEAFDGADLTVLGVNLAPLLNAGLFEEARKRFDDARGAGLDLVLWGDRTYPERLMEIPDPPPVLWVKGTLEPGDRYAVALVGSRAASPEGLKAARRLAREGAGMGLTIVSGLAKGVDARAHQGALEAGGRTLAVLGCGLDWVYPRENAALYASIAETGALISEFPPETKPLPVYFPRRNRVIAGLSLAVVVVEAGQRSGALITARLGLELNREVLALPGPAGAAWARGANNLIKSGAGLVENMAEVLAEIKPRLLEGLTAPEAVPALEPLEESGEAERAPEPPRAAKGAKPVKQRAESRPEAEPAPGTPEAGLWAALAEGPLDADSLTRAAGLTAAETAVALLNLELGGLATRLASGCYERTTSV